MNQLNEVEVMSQINPLPTKCGKCGKTIRAWTRYHRATVEPDGLDPRGIDLCPSCHRPPGQNQSNPQPAKA